MAMMTPAAWTPGHAVLMFFMWWIMMVAMMLPSAAPMILLFATVNRKQRDTRHPYAATSIFAFGYLAAWAGFSLVAVSAGGVRAHRNTFTDARRHQRDFRRLLLLAAGVYQLTRQACLSSPLPIAFACFLAPIGGAPMARYAWVFARRLRRLLLVPDGADVFWRRDEPLLIAGVALFVLLEKTVPAGIGSATGVALLIWVPDAGARVVRGAYIYVTPPV